MKRDPFPCGVIPILSYYRYESRAWDRAMNSLHRAYCNFINCPVISSIALRETSKACTRNFLIIEYKGLGVKVQEEKDRKNSESLFPDGGLHKSGATLE
jgi:hypothetical protein